jgi:hypothetical protein
MKWGFATTNEIKDLRPSFIAGVSNGWSKTNFDHCFPRKVVEETDIFNDPQTFSLNRCTGPPT